MKKLLSTLLIISLFTVKGFSQIKYRIVAMKFGTKLKEGGYQYGKQFKETGSIIIDFGKVYISTKGLMTLNIDGEIGDMIVGGFEYTSFGVTDAKTNGKYKFVVKTPVNPDKDLFNTYSILYNNGLAIRYFTPSIDADSE